MRGPHGGCLAASPSGPPSFREPPPHGFIQVAPAAQERMPPPLHLTLHAAPSPHVTMQLEEPVQSAVHPPFGQLIEQVLLPPHATADPVSTFTLHVLPPLHVTVLLVPVEMSQLLVPSHVVVQFEVQLPWHVDLPAQEVVQPEPQTALQVFFDSQL